MTGSIDFFSSIFLFIYFFFSLSLFGICRRFQSNFEFFSLPTLSKKKNKKRTENERIKIEFIAKKERTEKLAAQVKFVNRVYNGKKEKIFILCIKYPELFKKKYSLKFILLLLGRSRLTQSAVYTSLICLISSIFSSVFD